MHDCGAARADVPAVPGDHLPRRARLLPQVHGRRAHAAHHPESRAAGHALGAGAASASRRCSQDLEAPELLVLALLLHDVGKWRDEDHAVRKRAHGARDVRSARPAARGARDRRVPDRQSPPRCRRSRSAATPRIRRSSGTFAELVGIEERLKMLCLLTLADVEAVSLETLTPWREELLWRLLRRHLQPPDARLRRRADRARARRPSPSCSRTGRRTCRRPTSRTSSRGCRAGTCSCSIGTRSTGTCGCRATSTRTRCTWRSSEKGAPGS